MIEWIPIAVDIVFPDCSEPLGDEERRVKLLEID
jgi:hypothetical protein